MNEAGQEAKHDCIVFTFELVRFPIIGSLGPWKLMIMQILCFSVLCFLLQSDITVIVCIEAINMANGSLSMCRLPSVIFAKVDSELATGYTWSLRLTLSSFSLKCGFVVLPLLFVPHISWFALNILAPCHHILTFFIRIK